MCVWEVLLGDVDITHRMAEGHWRAVGLNGNPAVSFIQDFEHTTLNAYIFALILHLTCKTKKIILPLLLTSQITESLEKTFFS